MSNEITNLEVLPPENQPLDRATVPLKKATTLPNLWWKWQQTKEPLQPNTRASYYNTGRLFTEFFRNRKFCPEEFLNWHESVKARRTNGKPIKAIQVNKINTTARGFLRWLYQMQFTAHDLSHCIPLLPTPKTTEAKAVTEEQYLALKKFCAGKLWAQPYLWLIILGYRTGMSLTDCCHLRWNSHESRVHLDDNGPSYIDIIRRKMATRSGEKGRCLIPIVPGTDLHQALIERRIVQNYKRFDGIDDYVHQDCPGLHEWNGAFDSMHMMMRRIFRGAGIPRGTTFKNLRNSFCSNLVNSGMNIGLACKITGHNNPKTLLAYLKPDRLALQDGVAKAFAYSEAQLEKVNGIKLHETTTENIDGRRAIEEGDGGSATPEPEG